MWEETARCCADAKYGGGSCVLVGGYMVLGERASSRMLGAGVACFHILSWSSDGCLGNEVKANVVEEALVGGSTEDLQA